MRREEKEWNRKNERIEELEQENYKLKTFNTRIREDNNNNFNKLEELRKVVEEMPPEDRKRWREKAVYAGLQLVEAEKELAKVKISLGVAEQTIKRERQEHYDKLLLAQKNARVDAEKEVAELEGRVEELGKVIKEKGEYQTEILGRLHKLGGGERTIQDLRDRLKGYENEVINLRGFNNQLKENKQIEDLNEPLFTVITRAAVALDAAWMTYDMAVSVAERKFAEQQVNYVALVKKINAAEKKLIWENKL